MAENLRVLSAGVAAVTIISCRWSLRRHQRRPFTPFSVWITFGSIMFSITRLNIQWGTTCEKIGHSRAHCPFRSRENPFEPLQWSLRSTRWVLQERRNSPPRNLRWFYLNFSWNYRSPIIFLQRFLFYDLLYKMSDFSLNISRWFFSIFSPLPSRPGSCFIMLWADHKAEWLFYRLEIIMTTFSMNLLLFWFL